MTENNNDHVLTREWLASKLEQDRLAAEEAEQERRDERARDDMRAAWKQETGGEPSKAELEKALQEKRYKDVADTARANEAVARQQFRRVF